MITPQPLTVIFLFPGGAGPENFVGRLPLTRRLVASDEYSSLAAAGPYHPGGSTPYALVYQLAHNRALRPVKELTPAIRRQISRLTREARRRQAAIHLFGLVDDDSPYGSRQALEHLSRAFHAHGLPVAIHLGVWHPTPREFRQGVKEMFSLNRPGLFLASLFPVDLATFPTKRTSRYLDGLHRRAPSAPAGPDQRLPLIEPVFFDSPTITPDDILLVTNHSLHGLDGLGEGLAAEFGEDLEVLDQDHPTPPELVGILDSHRHILAVTNSLPGCESYFGTGLSHPYFERLFHTSALDLLGMLISPHFGYTVAPHRTVVILREARSPAFDRLLRDYLQTVRAGAGRYVLYLTEPSSVLNTVMATNHPNLISPHSKILHHHE